MSSIYGNIEKGIPKHSPLESTYQYSTIEKNTEAMTNTDIDIYINYADKYYVIEKELIDDNWTETLLNEKRLIEEKVTIFKNKPLLTEDGFNNSIQNQLGTAFDLDITYENYLKAEISNRLQLSVIYKSRLEAIRNKIEAFQKFTRQCVSIDSMIEGLDKAINEYERLLEPTRSLLYGSYAKMLLDFGYSFKSNPTSKGEADLNYLKENRLTDGSVLNPGTAFSLSIDGMALDGSLLNYGIDAGKLVDKAA